MSDCIFCKIAGGEIPSNLFYESDDIVAFDDISPQAPVHVIIIPRKHFATTLDMSDNAPELFGAMIQASSKIAREKGVDESGFRLILNTNADGGQEIFHVHMHLMGGENIGSMR
ncbi:histidine triad nucleotide-binding protein [Candidatus Latescibacterota bacterium]